MQHVPTWLDDYGATRAHFSSWISGFIDGEGSFIIYVSPDGKVRQRRLVVQLRADDIDVLRKLQGHLMMGSISVSHSPASASKPLARWSVQSRDDARRLVDHFERYPLMAKKRRDYEIWKRADPQNCNAEEMRSLREELRAVRQYAG